MSCPKLKFTSLFSVKWPDQYNDNGELWENSNISHIVFAGAENGTIASFKIILNENHDLKTIEPLCFIFGHTSKITCFSNCKQKIYLKCVVSISKDGTISIISVIDQTIIKNIQKLFSQNSQYVSSHSKNNRLLLASQEFGTIELADIVDEVVLMRIEGFNSTIYSLYPRGSLVAISCIDGSLDIFSINQTAECLYSIRRYRENLPCYSLISPNLSYLLIITKSTWSIYNSDTPIFSHDCDDFDDENEFYINGSWVNDDMFYIKSKKGNIELWSIPKSKKSVIDTIQTVKCKYDVFTIDENITIESQIINEDNNGRNLNNKNQLEPFLVHKYTEIPGNVNLTDEGFIIFSDGLSKICVQYLENQINIDLESIFKSDIIAKYPLGDPVISEVIIKNDSSIWVDNKKVGSHEGANMLFSKNENEFFSFSNNGSIKVWNRDGLLIQSFYDLCEPISKFKYLAEYNLLIIIGKVDSFSVIDLEDLTSVVLCTGHNSPIIDVILEMNQSEFLNIFQNSIGSTFDIYNEFENNRLSSCLFHAYCESFTIYTWNYKSMIVSKWNEIIHRPLGVKNSDQYIINNLIGNKIYKIVPMRMPNCHSYAIAFDVINFLQYQKKFDAFDLQNDPTLVYITLLWRMHIGEHKVHIKYDFGILDKFDYILSGDNFTVTLPVKKRKRSIFSFSPLTSTIHAIASSTLAQCFVGNINDENISVISSFSQTITSSFLQNANTGSDHIVKSLSMSQCNNIVIPSFSVIASYLLFKSSYLRSISINLLSDVMTSFTKEESLSSLETVDKVFGDWSIILPFALIHCIKYKLPSTYGKLAAEKIFPTIIYQKELFDILIQSFTNFSEYIVDLPQFFQNLINECINNKISKSKIIGLALIKPFEFFVVALNQLNNDNNVNDIMLSFIERWYNPDRSLVTIMIYHAIGAKVNPSLIDIILNTLSKYNPYLSFNKKYIAIGGNDGILKVTSKETNQVVWSNLFSSSQISCVCFSPNGAHLALAFQQTIVWISVNEKAKSFEIEGQSDIPDNMTAKRISWKGEGTLILSTLNGSIEMRPPKSSIFQKISNKLTVLK